MKIILIIGLVAVLSVLVMLVPPSSIIYIVLLMLVASTITGLTASLRLSPRYAIGSSIAVFTYLTMNYYVGFQILTSLLFFSVIIGILLLIRRPHE